VHSLLQWARRQAFSFWYWLPVADGSHWLKQASADSVASQWHTHVMAGPSVPPVHPDIQPDPQTATMSLPQFWDTQDMHALVALK
jgi:hypothetical protein